MESISVLLLLNMAVGIGVWMYPVLIGLSRYQRMYLSETWVKRSDRKWLSFTDGDGHAYVRVAFIGLAVSLTLGIYTIGNRETSNLFLLIHSLGWIFVVIVLFEAIRDFSSFAGRLSNMQVKCVIILLKMKAAWNSNRGFQGLVHSFKHMQAVEMLDSNCTVSKDKETFFEGVQALIRLVEQSDQKVASNIQTIMAVDAQYSTVTEVVDQARRIFGRKEYYESFFSANNEVFRKDFLIRLSEANVALASITMHTQRLIEELHVEQTREKDEMYLSIIKHGDTGKYFEEQQNRNVNN